jgi:adenylate kinase family enzyme
MTVDGLPLGRKIVVTGSCCSGKSTLGSELAARFSIPFVELDAINWLPDWVALASTDPEEFERRVAKATRGDEWVVSGSYSRHSKKIFWKRLDTVVWLDLPIQLLIRRVLVRSWRRSRSDNLIWGTNHEKFWTMFKIWDKEESLLAWILLNYRQRRRRMLESLNDPKWKHIRFIRVTSVGSVVAFRRSLGITGPPRHRD